MNEYRCTRNRIYESPGCPGHTQLEARQGHYIQADSEADALIAMWESFPDDVEWAKARGMDAFTATLWKGQGSSTIQPVS
jgi:hypothetical protein